MRNKSTKLYLAISAALAVGASGLVLAQDTQTQQSRTQQDTSTTTATSPGTSTTDTSTTGTTGTMGTDRSTTGTTGTMGTDRSTTGTTGTMGTDRSTTGTTGTMGTDRSTTGTTGTTGTMGTDRSTTGTTGTTGTMGTDRSTTGTTGTTGTMGAPGTTTEPMRGDGREYDQSRSTAQTRSTNQAGDVAWLVMPVNLQTQSDSMSRGCWVRLYSGENFEGRYVTIVGPSEVRELRSPYGTGLTKWDSAIVGPNATVTTFDGDNFDDRNATLRAGQRYPELDDSKLGLFQDIESVRVTCSAQGQSGQTGMTGQSGMTGTGQTGQTGSTDDNRQ
jgi:hypothetical protein